MREEQASGEQRASGIGERGSGETLYPAPHIIDYALFEAQIFAYRVLAPFAISVQMGAAARPLHEYLAKLEELEVRANVLALAGGGRVEKANSVRGRLRSLIGQTGHANDFLCKLLSRGVTIDHIAEHLDTFEKQHGTF